MARGPNVGRIIETGAFLGALTLLLAITGLLLSPTVLFTLGIPPFSSGFANPLFVTHMACALLLVAFTTWHLWPYAYAFSKKAGHSLLAHTWSYVLFALILYQILTGWILWSHDYTLMNKEIAVYTHLVATFVLFVPLAPHALRGYRSWQKRRGARDTALAVAVTKGKEDQAVASRRTYTRRMFIRVTSYVIAGIALASAFGRFVNDQVSAWRINSIGANPPLTRETWRLRITGLVGKPIELTYNQLLSLGRDTHRFTHHCVEGWSYTDDWTGVTLRKVLDLAGGVTSGAKVLIFKSPEVSQRARTRGQLYTTNFPYRADILDQVYLVTMVGHEDMPPEHGGPVRLMSPVKWGYKACKWLTEIEASSNESYRGYWERAGYHNVGDYPGPIFD